MSKVRRELDQYFTPRYAVEVLKKYIGKPYYIFEPCVGGNIIINAFQPHKSNDNDIDPNIHCTFNEDAADPSFWNKEFKNLVKPNEWCISNPPYNQAPAIVRNALHHFTNVAMLLRLSFLEPCRNRWDINPPSTLITINPRISFTEDGHTDNICTAWFIWSKQIKKGIFYEHQWNKKITTHYGNKRNNSVSNLKLARQKDRG